MANLIMGVISLYGEQDGNDGPQSHTVQESGTCLRQNMILTVRSARDENSKLDFV